MKQLIIEAKEILIYDAEINFRVNFFKSKTRKIAKLIKYLKPTKTRKTNNLQKVKPKLMKII